MWSLLILLWRYQLVFFLPASALPTLFQGFLCGLFTHILFGGIIYLLATPSSLKTIAWQNKQRLFDIFYEATSSLRAIFLFFVCGLLLVIVFFIFIFQEPSALSMLLFLSSLILPLVAFLGTLFIWLDYKDLCQEFIQIRKKLEKIN